MKPSSVGGAGSFGGGGAKKFVLRPVAKPQGMDQAEAYESFLKIAEAIGHINSGSSSHLSFEELYRAAYKLVLHKHGDLLYNGVCETIATHLNEERSTKITTQPDTNESLFLGALRQVYERCVLNLRLIKDVLMYLDRSHASNNRKLPIFEQGIVIFRSVVAQHPDLRPRVQRLLLEAIRKHRQGEAMDVSLIRSVLAMMVELGISNTAVYCEEFETPMLQQTAQYYHEESREVLASSPAHDYCKYAERRLNEERQRALLVMHPSTVPKLMALLEGKLIAEHAVALVEGSGGRGGGGGVGSSSSSSSSSSGDSSAGGAGGAGSGSSNSDSSGLVWQLEHDRYEDIGRLFRLFASSKQLVVWRPPPELAASEKDKEKASPPVVVLKDVMKAAIMRKGLALVFDPEKQKEPVELIQSLLDLRHKYAAIVEKAFHNDRLYNTGLKEAFENIVNRHQDTVKTSSSGGPVKAVPRPSSSLAPNCIPEFLALYIDEHLKAGGVGSKLVAAAASSSSGSGAGGMGMGMGGPVDDLSSIDQRLNDCIQLFRFLSAKDVFEEYYKQATAKRLLGGKVQSEDLERMMIGKLKAECGAGYTNKLEGMFADLNKSAAFMQQYKKDKAAATTAGAGAGAGAGSSTASSALPSVDIDVTVLTAPNWSSAVKPVPNAKLPPAIQAAADDFTRYYMSKHNGRKLQWNASKGTAEIKWRVGAPPSSRTYELTLSTYQMVILLAFNEQEVISYKDFASNDRGYGIPEDELRRNLLSLCNPKIKILNKHNPSTSASSSSSSSAAGPSGASSSTKEIDEEHDVFSVNEAFSSKLLRIKVPLISMKSAQAAQQAAAAAKGKGGAGGAGGAGGDAEAEEVLSNIEEGRKALLESVIVRIMKTRKHMEHNALVAEVLRMVSARFNPDLGSIKKRIEHLIDRDYLERSADNHNLYSYLA